MVGGQDITNDCFIKVLDYLDGPTNNYNMYQRRLSSELGYTTASTGGVRTEHFSTIASWGNLNLTEQDPQNPPRINSSTGLSPSGDNFMAIFQPPGLDRNHAVVVTGYDSAKSEFRYYDPTLNTTGTIAVNKTNLYRVVQSD